MGRKQNGDAAQHATPEQVEAAVDGLTKADLHRLEGYAKLRAYSLRPLGLGWRSDDLLQEALLRTFDGRRNWKHGITFVKHLIETMRSITSHVPKELKGDRPVPIDAPRDEGQTLGDTLVHNSSGVDDGLGAAEILADIGERFAEDEEVGLLIEALADSMSGPEVQEAFGWTQTRYETVMRRLRRSVRREEGWRP